MNDLLGHTYRDRITGFTGVATGVCLYISGCNQLMLAPRCEDTNFGNEPKWFDQQRLERLAYPRIELDNSESPGFDAPAPVR